MRGPTHQERSEPGKVPAMVSSTDCLRTVYCVHGLPIDALDIATVLRRIDASAASRSPFLISTPNFNFLVHSRTDPDFRESLLESDLGPADGMPIIWLARLIGAPIMQRVSGSDIFDTLRVRKRHEGPLQVFLFGGEEGVAATAACALNATSTGLKCVGTL